MADRTELRTWLVDTLATAAEIDAAQITDNTFFEVLGIDSVELYTITADLADWLEVDLEATLFWDHERVGEVVDLLAQDEPVVLSERILELNGSLRPPVTSAVFCVAGVRGHPSAYRDLARTLQLPVPVVGLGFPGPDAVGTPSVRPEDLATDLIERMREVQPLGPYRLLGHSYGGIVAFEIAQQLAAAGERVDFLGLLDAYLVSGVTKRAFHQRAHALATIYRGLDKGGRREFMADRRFNLRDRFDGLRVTAPEASDAPFNERLDELSRARSAAWSRYEAKPYDGAATLFRTENPADDGIFDVEPTSGWGAVVADLDVVAAPGRHEDVLEAVHAEEIAAALRPRLMSAFAAVH